MKIENKKTVLSLREFNRWRRGDSSLPMPDPKKIGDSLESACAAIEKLDAEILSLRACVRLTIMENLHLADGENCTLKRLKKAIGFKLKTK